MTREVKMMKARRFPFAACVLAVLALAGCSPEQGPDAVPSESPDNVVVWNEQTPAPSLPPVKFDETGTDEEDAPMFNPREFDANPDVADGYDMTEEPLLVAGGDVGFMESRGAGGMLGYSPIRLGLNSVADTFGPDGWTEDASANDDLSLSLTYVNEKYPGAVLQLDDGSYDVDGLRERIAAAGFSGYTLDFTGAEGDARPDITWMGGVTFGSSLEKTMGVYLSVCGQEYYAHDTDGYRIRAYQLSENYCIWFGFTDAGLQFVSLRTW